MDILKLNGLEGMMMDSADNDTSAPGYQQDIFEVLGLNWVDGVGGVPIQNMPNNYYKDFTFLEGPEGVPGLYVYTEGANPDGRDAPMTSNGTPSPGDQFMFITHDGTPLFLPAEDAQSMGYLNPEVLQTILEYNQSRPNPNVLGGSGLSFDRPDGLGNNNSGTGTTAGQTNIATNPTGSGFSGTGPTTDVADGGVDHGGVDVGGNDNSGSGIIASASPDTASAPITGMTLDNLMAQVEVVGGEAIEVEDYQVINQSTGELIDISEYQAGGAASADEVSPQVTTLGGVECGPALEKEDGSGGSIQECTVPGQTVPFEIHRDADGNIDPDLTTGPEHYEIQPRSDGSFDIVDISGHISRVEQDGSTHFYVNPLADGFQARDIGQFAVNSINHMMDAPLGTALAAIAGFATGGPIGVVLGLGLAASGRDSNAIMSTSLGLAAGFAGGEIGDLVDKIANVYGKFSVVQDIAADPQAAIEGQVADVQGSLGEALGNLPSIPDLNVNNLQDALTSGPLAEQLGPLAGIMSNGLNDGSVSAENAVSTITGLTDGTMSLSGLVDSATVGINDIANDTLGSISVGSESDVETSDASADNENSVGGIDPVTASATDGSDNDANAGVGNLGEAPESTANDNTNVNPVAAVFGFLNAISPDPTQISPELLDDLTTGSREDMENALQNVADVGSMATNIDAELQANGLTIDDVNETMQAEIASKLPELYPIVTGEMARLAQETAQLSSINGSIIQEASMLENAQDVIDFNGNVSLMTPDFFKLVIAEQVEAAQAYVDDPSEANMEAYVAKSATVSEAVAEYGNLEAQVALIDQLLATEDDVARRYSHKEDNPGLHGSYITKAQLEEAQNLLAHFENPENIVVPGTETLIADITEAAEYIVTVSNADVNSTIGEYDLGAAHTNYVGLKMDLLTLKTMTGNFSVTPDQLASADIENTVVAEEPVVDSEDAAIEAGTDSESVHALALEIQDAIVCEAPHDELSTLLGEVFAQSDVYANADYSAPMYNAALPPEQIAWVDSAFALHAALGQDPQVEEDINTALVAFAAENDAFINYMEGSAPVAVAVNTAGSETVVVNNDVEPVAGLENTGDGDALVVDAGGSDGNDVGATTEQLDATITDEATPLDDAWEALQTANQALLDFSEARGNDIKPEDREPYAALIQAVADAEYEVAIASGADPDEIKAALAEMELPTTLAEAESLVTNLYEDTDLSDPNARLVYATALEELGKQHAALSEPEMVAEAENAPMDTKDSAFLAADGENLSNTKGPAGLEAGDLARVFNGRPDPAEGGTKAIIPEESAAEEGYADHIFSIQQAIGIALVDEKDPVVANVYKDSDFSSLTDAIDDVVFTDALYENNGLARALEDVADQLNTGVAMTADVDPEMLKTLQAAQDAALNQTNTMNLS